MKLSSIKMLAEAASTDDFKTIIDAEKAFGLRPTKVPKGTSPEVKAKAAKMALDSWRSQNPKGMDFVDTSGIRRTLNGFDEVAELMKRFGVDSSSILAAKEQAKQVEEIASLAYSLSTAVFFIWGIRSNFSRSPEERELSKKLCAELKLAPPSNTARDGLWPSPFFKQKF